MAQQSLTGPRRLSEATSLIAMALVVIGFVASILYTQSVVASMQGAASEIVRDKAPSIELLAGARGDLHQLEMALIDYVQGGHSPEDLQKIQASEQSLQTHLSDYVALPTDLSEQGYVTALQRQMGDLREESGAAVARAQVGDIDGATDIVRGQLRPTVDRARELIQADIELNARQAREAATEIDQLRERSTRVAAILLGLMVAFAFAVALATERVFRRYAGIIEQAANRERERASELELFAARVAHDVLSPLTPVGISLDLLGRRFAGDERARELVARGNSALRRVRGLVDDLLSFARAGAQATTARAAVYQTCEEVREEVSAEAAAAKASVRVERTLPETFVDCSEVLLSTVLRNLIRNALRYLGDAPQREIVVRLEPAPAAVRIEVQDSGPGVPRGMERAIFEPYVRGAPISNGGLGLGLATVKRIVEAHHGEVGVRRPPEGGALFWFTLPVAA